MKILKNVLRRQQWTMGSVVMCLMALTLAARAENWPQWRGPYYNGSSTETSLPSQWSATENLAWTVDLPGPGAATPVIWGDQVFISSTDKAARTLLAICIERRTGKILWRQKVADGYNKDDRSTYASSSPVTDGRRLFFFYGNGALAAFDLSGQKLWARNIETDYGQFAFLWTFSTSPQLYQGKLYLQVLQRDVPVNGRGGKERPIPSYLLAMDPETGKTLWRAPRPSQAEAESREAFSTPIPFTVGGHDELLLMGGDCLTGHNPADGKELWRWGTWNPTRIGHWRLVPSPVAGGGVILACAPKGSPVYAIKAGGSGALNDAAVAWTSQEQRNITSDVPTPGFYDGDFFVLSDLRKTLTRIEPQSGKVKWSIATPGRSKYEASPTCADGKIYLMNFKGEVTVAKAADGQVLRTIPMGEEGEDTIRSSIAVSQGHLFIRTNRKLFCVGPR